MVVMIFVVETCRNWVWLQGNFCYSDGYGQELLQAAKEAKEPKLVVRNTFLDLEVPMPWTWQAVGKKCAMQTHYDCITFV